MNELKNPFAIIEGKLTHVKDINKCQTLICPLCGKELILKDGKVMIKHLAHKSDTKCGGESEIHKLVKQYIYENVESVNVNNHKIDLNYNNLALCGEEKLKVIGRKIEYSVTNKYRPDLLFKLEGNYYVAYEICYKNKKDKDKLKDILSNCSLNQVYEIEITLEDIENMDLDLILSKSKLIYNKLEYCLDLFKESEAKKITKNLNNILSKNKVDETVEVLRLKRKIDQLERDIDNKNTKIRSLEGYGEEHSNWLMKMQRDRIALLLEENQELKDRLCQEV